MSTTKDDKILALKVTSIVVNVIWSYAFPRIIKLVFIPYVLYFSLFISYITMFFDPAGNSDNELKYYFLPPCMLYSGFILLFEFN